MTDSIINLNLIGGLISLGIVSLPGRRQTTDTNFDQSFWKHRVGREANLGSHDFRLQCLLRLSYSAL